LKFGGASAPVGAPTTLEMFMPEPKEIDPKLLDRINVAIHESLMQMVRVMVQTGFKPASAISLVRERLDNIESLIKEEERGTSADVSLLLAGGKRKLSAEEVKARLAVVRPPEGGPGEGLPGAAGEPGAPVGPGGRVKSAGESVHPDDIEVCEGHG
jgi:hypothetical protein